MEAVVYLIAVIGVSALMLTAEYVWDFWVTWPFQE